MATLKVFQKDIKVIFSQARSPSHGFPTHWNCPQTLPTYRPLVPVQPNDMLTTTTNTYPNTNSTWSPVHYEGPDEIFIENGQVLTIRSLVPPPFYLL